ncbi:MAG: nuclear transport factor 2 family protein [Gammaproteobacteria bacterium]|nr:nuclear transport factor 2 family protein [Gammaproteobacteria bacterium]
MIGDPALLRSCADRLDIRELLARYCICVDTGDADGFAAIFTEDALWSWAAVGLEYRGRPALRRLAQAIAECLTGAQHLACNPVIRLDDNDATSICQLTVFLSRPECIYTVLQGFYEDDLVRRGGRWLIARRVVRVENPEIITRGPIGEYYGPLIARLSEPG